MSDAFDDPRRALDEQLGEQLEMHGVPQRYARGVVEAMLDLVPGPATTALTESELAFMHAAGVPDSAFGPEAERDNTFYEAASYVALSRELRESVLPTNAVAQALGKDAAHVRRLLSEGRLMSAGQVDGQTAYPSWQILDGKLLPGLREVLTAFPRDYHPLDIQRVMASPSDELGGRSPRAWLATGGSVDAVVQIVRDLAYL